MVCLAPSMFYNARESRTAGDQRAHSESDKQSHVASDCFHRMAKTS